MSTRTELDRLVSTMSEAEVQTVLKFVKFLEQGHIRPHIGGSHELVQQTREIIDDLVEIVDLLEQPEVELVHAPRRLASVRGGGGPGFHRAAPPRLLEGAEKVPRAEWGVVLDGFSHLFHDLNCHLWVQSEGDEPQTIAMDVPLGQIYFDDRGSECNSVQVALNRSGTVYGDFRFMHRIAEPRAIYTREAGTDELVDLIIESDGHFTVLETSIPHSPEPGVRKLAFLELIKECTGPDRHGAEPRR